MHPTRRLFTLRYPDLGIIRSAKAVLRPKDECSVSCIVAVLAIVVAVKVPFNTSAKREKTEKRSEQPGPGAYIDISNPINSSVMKGILKFASDRVMMEAQGIMFGPFGSTEKRFKGTYQSEKDATPGPGEYPRDENSKDDLEKIYERIAKPRANSKSSMFSSKTDRFRATFSGDPFVQAVGKENELLEQARRAMCHTGYAKPTPHYSWVNTAKASFNSTAPRWKTHRIVRVKSPGPGEYCVAGEMAAKYRNTRTAIGRRTKECSRSDYYRPRTGTNNRVGPGYYATDMSMVKRSFNMSLDNSYSYL
eukprot:TRINITY_DN1120_c0_g3_i2.p1 TRINITY_DN1120_c0_g3~~TRINITY_DN1120_c0_g3_i2.p1  ORF type:complete len:306 (-),score=50.64 TRINITY_DN1120_c0_g3_i2:112-1029(-)